MRTSLAILLTILGLHATAHADARFQIHRDDGAFVETFKPCGTATRNALASSVLRFTPILVIDNAGTMTLVVRTAAHPADEMIDGIGWWSRLGAPSFEMSITLKAADRSSRKIVAISVTRYAEKWACRETWQGIAKRTTRPVRVKKQQTAAPTSRAGRP